MTPVDVNTIMLATLTRVEGKVDELAERVTRVETLVKERTVKQNRQELMSRSAWTTVISGVIIGVWEVVKLKMKW